MKLKNIKINNLFGLEQNNFDLPLYPEEKVTLLYGFNGLGKTTIIKLISSILSCDLKRLLELKFSTVRLTFEDNSILVVDRDLDFKNTNVRTLRIKSRKENKDYFHPITFTEIFDDTHILYKFRIVGSEKHMAFEERNPQCLDEESLDKIRNLQNKLMSKVDLHIIYGNRDFNRVDAPYAFKKRIRFEKEEPNKKLMFCTYREAEQIIEILSKQIKEIQEEFPELIHHNSERNLDFFSEGQLPDDVMLQYYSNIPDKLDELLKYIFENKEDLIDITKVQLFEEIINQKMGLMFKNIKFKKDSLSIENIYSTDEDISLKALSSGEKNILCLFLEIIFLGKDNSIFFIDEPETSLHVEWQSHLVDCFLRICSEYNMQVILTTHAPEVVGNYDGLTTEIASERFQYGNKYFDC